MKRFKHAGALFFLLLAAFTFVGCKNEIEFNEADLYGKWVNGTEYYRYDRDSTGVRWDTADDVREEEGQRFEWTLEGDQLAVVHLMEMGGKVPKVYTLLRLDASYLVYKDNYSQTFTFKRVARHEEMAKN